MKDEAVDEAYLDEVVNQAFRELVREGYLVDSGRRTWNELTGRYEFVLVAARKKLNSANRKEQAMTRLSSTRIFEAVRKQELTIRKAGRA